MLHSKHKIFLTCDQRNTTKIDTYVQMKQRYGISQLF